MSRRRYERTFYSGRGSSSAWAGWEPRVCFVCGRRVTHKQASGHSYGDPANPQPRSWHADCYPA